MRAWKEKKTNCFILQYGIDVKAYCASGDMPKSDECAAGECWSERARMLETCQRVDRSVCPRLEWESLCQTNMRTVYHRVTTQNGTEQCHDSTNNIWRRETSFSTIREWDTDPSAFIFSPVLDEFRCGLFAIMWSLSSWYSEVWLNELSFLPSLPATLAATNTCTWYRDW